MHRALVKQHLASASGFVAAACPTPADEPTGEAGKHYEQNHQELFHLASSSFPVVSMSRASKSPIPQHKINSEIAVYCSATALEYIARASSSMRRPSSTSRNASRLDCHAASALRRACSLRGMISSRYNKASRRAVSIMATR